MEFKDIEFNPHSLGGGVQGRVDFSNGYGASIVKSEYSYGGNKGLWELAVLKNGGITYDTSITNDVLGHLTEKEVTETLQKIEKLPPFATLKT